ncbi:unnamed protein product, partial [Adineta steineri]|jgi:hypothetical protein
MIPEP